MQASDKPEESQDTCEYNSTEDGEDFETVEFPCFKGQYLKKKKKMICRIITLFFCYLKFRKYYRNDLPKD